MWYLSQKALIKAFVKLNQNVFIKYVLGAKLVLGKRLLAFCDIICVWDGKERW